MAVLDIDSLGIVQGPPLVFDQTFSQTVLNDNTITQLGYQYLPDADSYLVLNAVYKMQATTMTANRALIVPNAVYNGARIGIFNANTTAYTLTLSGGSTVKFTDGTVLSTLLNQKFYWFVWFDGEWIVESEKYVNTTLWDYWTENIFMVSHQMTALTGTAVTSGSVAASSDDLGYLQHGVKIASSASANSGYRFGQAAIKNFLGTIAMKCRCALMPKTSHTNRVIITGFASSSNPTTEPVNGCYFWIVGGTVTAKTSQASTRTSHGTTYNLTIDKPYIFDVEVNAAASSVRYRIWGEQNETAVYDQTITTNIPTGLTQGVMPVVGGIHTGAAISDIANIYKLGFGTPNGFLKS